MPQELREAHIFENILFISAFLFEKKCQNTKSQQGAVTNAPNRFYLQYICT